MVKILIKYYNQKCVFLLMPPFLLAIILSSSFWWHNVESVRSEDNDDGKSPQKCRKTESGDSGKNSGGTMAPPFLRSSPPSGIAHDEIGDDFFPFLGSPNYSSGMSGESENNFKEWLKTEKQKTESTDDWLEDFLQHSAEQLDDGGGGPIVPSASQQFVAQITSRTIQKEQQQITTVNLENSDCNDDENEKYLSQQIKSENIKKEEKEMMPKTETEISQQQEEDLMTTEFYQTTMGRVDLDTCLGTNWLSNLVIDAYLELIIGGMPNAGAIPSYAIGTFRTSRDFPRVWLSNVSGIEGIRFWLIPAHFRLNIRTKLDHWALAILDIGERKLCLYDSLSPGKGNDKKADFMRDCIAFFQAFYARKGMAPLPAIIQKNMANVPRQENGYDCGVFVLMIAQTIAMAQDTDANLFAANVSQERASKFRQIIYNALCKEKLDSANDHSAAEPRGLSKGQAMEIGGEKRSKMPSMAPSDRIKGKSEQKVPSIEAGIGKEIHSHFLPFIAALTAEQMGTCHGTNQLSEAIINAYLEKIILSMAQMNARFIPAAVSSVYLESGKLPKDWLDSLANIHRVQLWFMPVRFNMPLGDSIGHHWALALLNLATGGGGEIKLHFFDTLSAGNLRFYESISTQNFAPERTVFMPLISRMLGEMYAAKGYSLENEKMVQKVVLPLGDDVQENSNNSAVFVLMFAYFIANNANGNVDMMDLSSVRFWEIPKFREKIFNELAHIRKILVPERSSKFREKRGRHTGAPILPRHQKGATAFAQTNKKVPPMGGQQPTKNKGKRKRKILLTTNSDEATKDGATSSLESVEELVNKLVKCIKPTIGKREFTTTTMQAKLEKIIPLLPRISGQALKVLKSSGTFKTFKYAHNKRRGANDYWRCSERQICNARLGIFERNNQSYYRLSILHTCRRMDGKKKNILPLMEGELCVRPHDDQLADYAIKLYCLDKHNLALTIWWAKQKNKSGQECVPFEVDIQFCVNDVLYFEVIGGKSARRANYFKINRNALNGVILLEMNENI